jgi:Uncharacterised nucleotidyltransferase
LYFTRSDDLTRWTAFLDLCALLAPQAIASEPLHDWDWKLIVRLASDHMITPAVWRSINGRDFVPDEVKAYFREIHKMNTERNALILGALIETVSRLQGIGIEPILLKGAASLASGLYTDPGERVLVDVDLLVSSRQVEAAAAALCGMGYVAYAPLGEDLPAPSPDLPPRWVRRNAPQKPHFHIAPWIHPSGIFSIEIHRSLVTEEFERILPTDNMFARAVAIQWNGHSVFVLHPTDRIVHNIVHAQLLDARFFCGTIELRQTRELAFLAAHDGHAVDWQEVEYRFSSTGHANVLAEQAALCPALMGVPLPVLAADVRHSMHRLRQGLHPRATTALATVTRDYIAGFLNDPWLALNLANPFWWPQRIRGIWRLLQRSDAHYRRFSAPRARASPRLPRLARRHR